MDLKVEVAALLGQHIVIRGTCKLGGIGSLPVSFHSIPHYNCPFKLSHYISNSPEDVLMYLVLFTLKVVFVEQGTPGDCGEMIQL